MPKTLLQYKEIRLIKPKRKKKFFIKGVLFFIFLVGFVVLLTTLFSGAFNLNNLSIFGAENIKIKAHTYYAVSMGKYDNLSEAEAVASGTSVMGAGSYIWHHKDRYYVIGNVYNKKESADSVKNNISTRDYDVEVLEIKYDTISYSVKEYSKEQRNSIKESITYIDQIYNKCYDYSIRYDKGEVVGTVVSSELNTLKGDIMVRANRLDVINSVLATSPNIDIKNTYISIINQLDNTILKVIDGTTVNKDLKYLTTSIVVAKYDLYSKLSKY